MKNGLICFLVILLFLPEVNAQRRNGLIVRRLESAGSLILSVGPTYCIGDQYGFPLNKSLSGGIHNIDVSLGFRHRFTGNYGYKATLSYNNFAGDDMGNPRGFSFVSNEIQLTIQGEYAIFWGKKYGRTTPHSLYGFAGFGIMNSKADLIYDPVKRGNAGDTYQATDTAPLIPFGMGYQYEINQKMSLGAEGTIQYTFSDFVEGFKTKKSTSNDVFMGLVFTFQYKIF